MCDEYQICPKCNGGGFAPNMLNQIPLTTDICDVCNGKKIISHPGYLAQIEEAQSHLRILMTELKARKLADPDLKVLMCNLMNALQKT